MWYIISICLYLYLQSLLSISVAFHSLMMSVYWESLGNTNNLRHLMIALSSNRRLNAA